jgi:hypothetical protein
MYEQIYKNKIEFEWFSIKIYNKVALNNYIYFSSVALQYLLRDTFKNDLSFV